MVVLTPLKDESLSCEVCSIAGCEREVFGRGWCRSHYYRWQRYGDPLGDRDTTRAERDRRAEERSEEAAVKSQPKMSGVRLPGAPFHAWIRHLETSVSGVRQTDVFDPPKKSPRQILGERLGISPEGIYRWLHAETIDESVVERAAAREHTTVWQIYEDFAEPPVVVEPVERKSCASPGCDVSRNGGRFCHEHAERLAKIRAEFEDDGAIMSANGGATRRKSRAKTSNTPVCCAPNCWAPREPGERFCGDCVDAGWSEEDYE
jgi:hypothetical protein